VSIHFEVRMMPAGTGLGVWDNPHAHSVVQRWFMPRDRQHGPMIGILNLGDLHPAPNVLRDVIVTIGKDVQAGRYGNFTFMVSSNDDATRTVVSDIASGQNLPIFVGPIVVGSSMTHLEQAEPVGDLTAKERETLSLVLRAGGTVTVAELAQQVGIEQTTAGNRLISLHKKGYLQRIERPHPVGDQFVDPRSVRFDLRQ